MTFRTVEIPIQLPLAASDLAFGDLERDSEAREQEREARANAARQLVETPSLARRTVAVVYVSSGADSPELDGQSLSAEIHVALDALNDWLISLGVLFDDRIRPIAVDELPPAVPVMEARYTDQGFSHGPGELFHLRDHHEDVETREDEEMQQVGRMLAIVGSGGGLGSFYEVVQRAGSARRAGRHREAVIDYGTAGELFITRMLNVAGRRHGMEAAKLANIVGGPFKDRARHLCRLLNCPDDPEDSNSPLFLWWLHCYLQRNRILHGGADSMGPLSESARIGLVELVVGVREAFRQDDVLADLASTIYWGRRIDHTGGGRDSEPDALPPVH